MLQDKLKDTVFLPIKPKYAQAIMRGEKKVEFRKQFPTGVKQVIVYSSSPEKKILGWFNVDEIEITKPKHAWEMYCQIGSISETDFFSYYENKESATVIKVKKVFEFTENVPATSELGITPPQSYSYVKASVWETLQKYAK